MALPIPLVALAAVLSSTILTTVVYGQALTTSCSKPNRAADLDSCLSRVRQEATNISRFWFGTEYAARCPSQKKSPMECDINLAGSQSLASLLFGNNIDLSMMDRYIEVNFTSPAGSYDACDYHYTQQSAKTFSIDPLSSASYAPWDLRRAPSMGWTSNNGEVFALLVVHVATGSFHGVFVNIPGSDLSKAEVLKPYDGPTNARNIDNPYAFVLYTGVEPIDPLPEDRNMIQTGQGFSITDFVSEHNLRGPVGLSWMVAGYDAYAIKRQGQMGNCAALVSEAYSSHKKRPFLERNPDLSVFMRVRFTTKQINMPCGKTWQCFRNDSIYADAIGNVIYPPAKARTGSQVDITVTSQLDPNDTAGFEGKMYTLLAVDPDIPPQGMMAGSNERPLLHWLVTNMPVESGKLKIVNQIHPYWGPGPPDPPPHTYYFLLYEQTGELQVERTDQFTGGCSDRLAGRCTFDVNMFARTFNLTLVGASWILAQNDRDNFLKCRGMSRDQPAPTTNEGKCDVMEDVIDGASVVGAPTRTLAASLVLLAILHRRYLFIR